MWNDKLDDAVANHLSDQLEPGGGEVIDGIDYRTYYHPITENTYKCWIDKDGKFNYENT